MRGLSFHQSRWRMERRRRRDERKTRCTLLVNNMWLVAPPYCATSPFQTIRPSATKAVPKGDLGGWTGGTNCYPSRFCFL